MLSLNSEGHTLYCCGRSRSEYGSWIEIDVNRSDAIQLLHEKVRSEKVDLFLYLGGTWEKGAFTSQYSFSESSECEIRGVIDVNHFRDCNS